MEQALRPYTASCKYTCTDLSHTHFKLFLLFLFYSYSYHQLFVNEEHICFLSCILLPKLYWDIICWSCLFQLGCSRTLYYKYKVPFTRLLYSSVYILYALNANYTDELFHCRYRRGFFYSLLQNHNTVMFLWIDVLFSEFFYLRFKIINHLADWSIKLLLQCCIMLLLMEGCAPSSRGGALQAYCSWRRAASFPAIWWNGNYIVPQKTKKRLVLSKCI